MEMATFNDACASPVVYDRHPALGEYLTFDHLPGALFASERAYADHRDAAAAFEAACAGYESDRDEVTFADALRGLGYDWREISDHIARPGYRCRQLYVS